MKPTCARLFEAEALRDGRLGGSELLRFQSHLRSCAVCAQETKALQVLAEELRSPTGIATTDELHVRRERTRLLAAFDASLMPVARRRNKLWLAGAALAVLALFALALRLRPSRPSPVAPVATTPNAVNVQANTAAKWSRQSENQRETVTLESGTLSIHVDHALPSQRRLLVLLPDGELEDIGTTFSVTAAAAQTTQVTVQEGRVILRLRGKPALALAAGDTWTPAPEPVVTATARPTAASTPRSAKPTLSSPPTLAPPAAASAPEPSTDFHDAMSALNAGDNARAASLFGAFLALHPRDSHAEDAAYLRVLALQRAGSSSAMHQAATEYLTRYPHGFRRADVEPLSH